MFRTDRKCNNIRDMLFRSMDLGDGTSRTVMDTFGSFKSPKPPLVEDFDATNNYAVATYQEQPRIRPTLLGHPCARLASINFYHVDPALRDSCPVCNRHMETAGACHGK